MVAAFDHGLGVGDRGSCHMPPLLPPSGLNRLPVAQSLFVLMLGSKERSTYRLLIQFDMFANSPAVRGRKEEHRNAKQSKGIPLSFVVPSQLSRKQQPFTLLKSRPPPPLLPSLCISRFRPEAHTARTTSKNLPHLKNLLPRACALFLPSIYIISLVTTCYLSRLRYGDMLSVTPCFTLGFRSVPGPVEGRLADSALINCVCLFRRMSRSCEGDATYLVVFLVCVCVRCHRAGVHRGERMCRRRCLLLAPTRRVEAYSTWAIMGLWTPV